MSTAIQPATPVIENPFADVHLVARNPNEMALAKSNLQMWLKGKIGQCDQESSELFEATEVARTNGWKFDTLARHANLAKRRGEFYRKVLTAVDAGYTIVPNFPVDLFAVRVKRESPRPEHATSAYSCNHAAGNVHDVTPQILPAGEGKYVSPTPMGRGGEYQEKQKDGKEITKYFFNVTDFTDIQFPIEAARPEVMDATAEAMALRVFEQIGICPQSRKGDPLIIGQVLGPKVGFTQKQVSFLIAWHLDLRTL
jgi:hypothetical protein